jgi:hypothetical protein
LPFGGSQVISVVIAWDELEEIGKLAFDVWVDQPELNWAKEAWARLSEKGLTRYADELEKTEVKMRFLALAGLYHDFCYKGWGETSCPMYRMWIDEMEISGVRLGQLVGRDPGVSGEEEDDLHYSAARKLIRKARPEVFAALLEAYGGTSGLLVSLWNSLKTHDRAECEYDNGCDKCKESDDEILNWNIEDKEPAYIWLDQGAEALLDDGD